MLFYDHDNWCDCSVQQTHGSGSNARPWGTRHVSLYTHSVPQPFLIPTNPVTREAEILSSNLTGAGREGRRGRGRRGVLGRPRVVEIKLDREDQLGS